MVRRNKAVTQAQYAALSSGLTKFCANSTFIIGGKSYTTPEVVSLISGLQSAYVTVVTPTTAAQVARKAIVAAEASDGKTVNAVRDIVEVMFSNDETTLTEMAITPRKAPKPLSAAARAAATAKATRKARGTTSKKQKAKITGNVTGVQIVPVMGSGPSASAQPVLTAAGGSSSPATPVGAVATGTATSHA